MDALVLIPVGALLVAASLRFEKAAGRGLLCGMAVMVVFGLFLGVRALLPDETVFFASEVSRRVRAQIQEFRKSGSRDYLVLEGSSVTAHGCDPKVVRQELAASGLDVGVLQFSAQGANHFERTFLMDAFWRGLTSEERGRLESGRVVMAREVFDSYDREPLYLFQKDSYTERAKVYMSPEYAWAAWDAHWNSLPIELSATNKAFVSLGCFEKILERLLMNRFGAGALSGMDFRAFKKKTGAFFGMEGSKPSFDYQSAEKDFRKLQKKQSDEFSIPRGWFFCNEFKTRKTKAWVDKQISFAMPALEINRYTYQNNFQRISKEITIGPPAPAEMEKFFGSENWFDGVHPTKDGAVDFSKWLGKQAADIEIFK